MNQSIGKFFSYFLPIIVILVIYIVISRYVFGVGRADLQELALYLHALVFLGCAGWLLLRKSMSEWTFSIKTNQNHTKNL